MISADAKIPTAVAVKTERPGNEKPHLWQNPRLSCDNETPRYKLRLSVLRDGELQGDVPTKTFYFPSIHHLTHATNSLDLAFGPRSANNLPNKYQYTIRKHGVEAPNDEVEDGKDADGKTEDVIIEYECVDEEDERGEVKACESWKAFLTRLAELENVWVGESRL